MTDYRALCAELITALHDAADDVEGWGNYASDYFQVKHDLTGNIAKIHAQSDRARAALAEAEPVGPTPRDVTELFYRHMGEGSEVGFENAIAEALARGGHPDSALPLPEGGAA